MKKLFTLIAGLLLTGSGAFAQSEWVDLVVNGNMEGEQDAKWSSFWCHDWRRGLGDFDPESGQQYDKDDAENGQFQGFAEIIVDPLNPNNHCARVVARSSEEAEAAGNMVKADGKLASWDCQFFVYANDVIPEGKELRMTMRVRAEKDGSFETQAHWKPGDYNYWSMFGNINVTTEWTKIQVTATIGADQTQSANEKFMQSVAFNLSTNVEGNVYYFDDVKLEIRDPKGPEEFAGWFNMLRHGTESADKIGNFTTFTGRDGVTNRDQQARIVIDEDGQPALTVAAIGYNASTKDTTYVEVKDEEGNTVVDDEGNPVTEMEVNEVPIYITENGDTLKLQNSETYGIDDFRTQFFVTTPHKYVLGEKIKVGMWARADKDQQIDTQVHRMPGDYQHWQFLGSLDLTPEWQHFDLEVEIGSDHKGGQTIAFNCNKLKTEDSNLYFRFDEVSFNLGDVSEEERTLGSEAVRLPVPEPGKEDGVQGSIDFAECLKVLEANSFENLVNENMTVPTGEDAYGDVDVTAGFFLDEKGYQTDSEKSIILEMEEPSNDNPQLTVTVYNETEESFTGKSIDTKFRYKFDNWFYVFNVSLVSEENYAGISETKAVKNAGIVYDLMGRKVSKPGKGLYIQDGRKFFVK